MFDAPITLRETTMTRTSPTLADVFRLVFSYMREHPDGVLFGSQAVNAYVDPPRMTADVDIMSTDAEALSDSLRSRIAAEFHIATRVRVVAGGKGFRVYQLPHAGEKSRHLVDVRQVDTLPTSQEMNGIQVVVPADLVVLKLVSFAARRNTDKGLSDKLDIHRMLLAFPEFRSTSGPVATLLLERNAPPAVWDVWHEVLAEQVSRYDDDEY